MEEGEARTNLDAFLRWATEMGISDSPCRDDFSQTSSSSCLGKSLVVSHFPDAGGRGLAAARELRRGERILRVPRDALLTSDSVLKDEKLAACVKRHPHLSSTQILTVCLIAEVGKGRHSRWYLYLMQLPQSYTTVANFNSMEIKALQDDDAMSVSEKIISKICSEWKDVLVLMREIDLKPQLLTYRAWLWAATTVSSRALHVPWDNAGCLCPVGDLFNYAAPEDDILVDDAEVETSSTEHNCFSKQNDATRIIEDTDFYHSRLTDGGYEEKEGAYCFYARKRYRKEEQVLLCYGTYTNLELLEHYGFLLNVNQGEKAFIRLHTDIYSSSSCQGDLLYIQQDGRPSFALLCTLRLWTTPHNLRKAAGYRAYSGLQLSVENEISVMKWLAERCQDVLLKMPTTVTNDCSVRDSLDKLMASTSWKECMDLFANNREIKEFFYLSTSDGGADGEVGPVQFPLPGKLKRSLERFRLAVQWRMIYKRALVDCISYCARMVDMLSSRSVPDA